MRQGVAQATNHAAHRSAFGKVLTDQPLMQNVLADLAVESEAATLTAMRLARAYDEAGAGDEQAATFKRLATAVAKYWTCKRAPVHAVESLECFGGNGFVEESGMPRLLRDSPLNGIWEGSGNVIALDVLRALAKEPQTLEAFFDELGESAGAEPRLDAYVGELRDEFSDLEAIESGPAAWWRRWAWRSRARCSCAMATRRSRTRSAPRAWRETAGASSGRCPRAWTSSGSWSERGPGSEPCGTICACCAVGTPSSCFASSASASESTSAGSSSSSCSSSSCRVLQGHA